MSRPLRLIIVEDSPDDAELMMHSLQRNGVAPTWTRVETAAELESALETGDWDAVLSDYTLPEFDAAAAIEIVHAADPDLPVLVVSGTVGEDKAVETMRAGASDYVLKHNLVRLGPALDRELRAAENRREQRKAQQLISRLAAIVESSDDAIISCTLDGTITDFNAGAERLYGYSAAEVVGLSDPPFVPADRFAQRHAALARLGRGERVEPLEAVRYRRDGTRVDVVVSISPMRDAKGRIFGASNIVRDVTAKKLAEDALQKSETRYRRLFEAAQDGVLIVDAASRKILDANPFLANLLGYRRDDLVGKELWEIGLFRDIEANKAAFRTLQEVGYVRYDDHPLQTKDGRQIDVEFVSNTNDVDGVRKIQCNIRDITEQKRAVSALLVSEERYRMLVGATAAIVWDCPASGQFDTEQARWTAFTGQTVHEHAGWGWLNAIHPDDREKSAHAWAAAVRDTGTYQVEHRVRRADGEYRQMSVRAVPIFDASGAIREWFGVHTDVTDQRRAETLLRASEARFKALIEKSFDGVVLLGADGTISYVTPAIERDSGWAPHELLGRKFYEWKHADDLAMAATRHTALVQQPGSNYSGQTRLRKKDGSYFWTESTVTNLLADPDVNALVINIRDITDRKCAEEAVRASEERFRAFMDNSPATAYIKDEEGRFLYVNATWRRQFDPEPIDWLGKTNYDYWPSETADFLHAKDKQCLATNLPLQDEVTLRTTAGNELSWVMMKFLLIENGCRRIGTIAWDIADRKRAEAALRQSEERFRAFMDHSPAAADIKDAEGRLLYVNAAWRRQFAPEPIDWQGKTNYDYWPRETAALFRTSDLQCLAHNMAIKVEAAARMASGDERTFLVMKVPFLEGGLPRIGGMAWDITDRVRAESALRLRDRALAVATQGLLISDVQQPDNPTVYVSPGFERMTGYRVEEVLGRNCRFLQGKDTDPASVTRLREAIEAGSPCSVELLNYRKDGTPFWNEVSISPVRDAAGLLTHFVGVQADVSARRALEEQFRQAQKMDAFGQLAGGVAHDFNNLITIINGYSDIVLRGLAPDDKSRGFVKEIITAGERSAALTAQLLAFSRKQVVVLKVLDLNAVVLATEKMLQRIIGEDIELVTSLAENLGSVRADSGQLEQVLLNLAVNARDAMPHGGKLTIETKNVELENDYAKLHVNARPGSYVLLAASDTGCGMTEEVKKRIFEPFFTTKGVGEGTGLGLATVFGIVTQADGRVEVYSEVNFGTSFKIYLPRINKAVKPRGDSVHLDTIPTGTESILLVEDEVGLRGLLSQVLNDCGYSVYAVASGINALQLSQEYTGTFDLIVTDVVMPGMSGRQMVEQLVARYPKVKVIYMSGYTDDAVVRHGILYEQVPYLQKPVLPVALARKVREVLDS